MYKVKTTREMRKRIVIGLKDGREYLSDWYEANMGSVDYQNYSDMLIQRVIEDNGINEEEIDHVYTDRMMEKDELYLSDHAADRLKERNGWSKKTSIRMLPRIYEKGMSKDKIRGPFAAWIRHKEKTKLKNEAYRLYGDSLYIFDRQILVTVVKAPTKRSFFNPVYNANGWDECEKLAI